MSVKKNVVEPSMLLHSRLLSEWNGYRANPVEKRGAAEAQYWSIKEELCTNECQMTRPKIRTAEMKILLLRPTSRNDGECRIMEQEAVVSRRRGRR